MDKIHSFLFLLFFDIQRTYKRYIFNENVKNVLLRSLNILKGVLILNYYKKGCDSRWIVL